LSYFGRQKKLKLKVGASLVEEDVWDPMKDDAFEDDEGEFW